MECRVTFCRIVLLLVLFVCSPGLGGKASFAAAQDTGPASADAILGSKSQIDASEQPIPGEEQPGSADVGLSSDSPSRPAGIPDPDTQAQQSPSESDSYHQPDRFVHVFVHDFVHDQYRMWTGPFRAHNYSTHMMKRYGLPFLLISGTLLATDRETAKWLPNTTGQVLLSSRVSEIGAPYTDAGIALGTYLVGRATKNPHTRETGFLALESVADSQFIVLILKEITQRQRPLQGTQRGGFWEGGDSFPSGHAAGAFAIAAVFSYEYRDHIAVPITAYSLATLVDASRLGARQHWLSDLFVGSAIGFLTGRYVYKQHHDPDLPGSPTSPLRPKLAVREQGLGLYWDF